MAKQTEFQRQLSDPRWQKKRLQILERDEWTCQTCGDTEATLTVHHKSYRYIDGKFADVWDYDDRHLITLCQECHSDEEEALSELQNVAFYRLRDACDSAETIDFLLRQIEKLVVNSGGRLIPPDLLDMHNCSGWEGGTNDTD